MRRNTCQYFIFLQQQQQQNFVDFQITIQECLNKFAQLANQLRLATNFLQRIQYSSRTLASFAQTLREQINRIHIQLGDIERRCLAQNSTYTLALFNQELDSLGIFCKGKCIERIFDQISFDENKLNCDLTLELIHMLYNNLLISEMINNRTFFVR